VSLGRTQLRIERDALSELLTKYAWHVPIAAHAWGVSESYLYTRIHFHGLKRPPKAKVARPPKKIRATEFRKVGPWTWEAVR
jgi:hypothetical protein